MARFIPKNANDAPTGWLDFKGLTDSAFLRFTISAIFAYLC
jgi:hypothetical protein